MGTFAFEPLLTWEHLYFVGNLAFEVLREPVPCNFAHLGNLVGTLIWEPLLGKFAGTCAIYATFGIQKALTCRLGDLNLGTSFGNLSHRNLGNLYLEIFAWKPLLGNFRLGTFTREPCENLYHGDLYLTWQPLLVNLPLATFAWISLLGNFTWKPVQRKLSAVEGLLNLTRTETEKAQGLKLPDLASWMSKSARLDFRRIKGLKFQL